MPRLLAVVSHCVRSAQRWCGVPSRLPPGKEPAPVPAAAVQPRRPRGLLTAGLALLAATSAWALDPTRELLHYNCRTWTRENGLPVNGIHAIAQDQAGYLWFGTAAGLVRFDGVTLHSIDLAGVRDLPNTIVNCLTPAPSGGLWVGLLNSSFGFHDGREFTFRGKEIGGSVEMNVRSILAQPDGGLLITAQHHAATVSPDGRYSGFFGDPKNTDINITCSYLDRKGRLWLGLAWGGMICWDQGKVTKIADPPLAETPIFALAEDGEGRLWVGTARGLFCYDANFQRIDVPRLKEEVRALLVDRHGVLWIGTSGIGLVRYQDGRYTGLSKHEGLASVYVNAILEDREGTLWVGTRDGISQLTDIKFPTYRAAEQENVDDALCVGASRKGGVWIGSSGGLSYFDGKLKTYFTEAGLPNAMVRRLFEASNGDVYGVSGIGAREIFVFSEGKVVATHTANSMAVGIAEDAKGVVVSIAGGLYRAGRAGLTPYPFIGDEPAFHWILNIATGRDGALWLATEKGIFRVQDGAWRSWAGVTGGPPISAQWVSEDEDGVVWAACLTGVARLKDGRLSLITRDDGLFDNNIYAVVPDEHGSLWIDSGRGIFRVSRQSMNELADGKIGRVISEIFDGPESVKTTDKNTQQRLAATTLDGRIWFPTPRGVVAIDPARVPMNPLPPPVHIDRLVANRVELPVLAEAIVPPGRGDLQFYFTGLSFIASQKVRFRYRLEGYQQEWVEVGDRRSASYTNLPPGRYTFRVIAANADGVWNGAGDALVVQLLPRFHQTTWFHLLSGGGVCALLGAAYVGRMRRLDRKQQALRDARDQLEAEVTSRTAELARANTSLTREIEEHKRTEQELEQRTRALEDEIEEGKRMQLEIERVHRQLLETSRQAGMAEVATSVLHNVGNVLNSVNVSATIVGDKVRRSKFADLARLSGLLETHAADLAAFLHQDPKGRMVLPYLKTLSTELAGEQKAALAELENLRKNIDHIKEIVAMQQSYAKTSGVTETVSLPDMIEDALRMNAGSLARHEVDLLREYHARPVVTLEKHKLLQILVNLVRNAKYACDEGGRTDKLITLRIDADQNGASISVIDNGIGIPRENLTRIFAHGFTTRKNGHGFGLHSGALSAKEMGGSLTAFSDGPGLGARFVLTLPYSPAVSAS